jgi:surface protein
VFLFFRIFFSWNLFSILFINFNIFVHTQFILSFFHMHYWLTSFHSSFVLNVTVFYGASAFDRDVSKWQTDKVTNMAFSKSKEGLTLFYK